MSSSKLHRFEHGAMSIIQMGEELIGHPTTAINELVKNAYDADADKCYVYIHIDKEKEKSFLIIKDDGDGMNDEVLFGPWLQPSISKKRNIHTSDKYARIFLGSKGIGRLAAMALGSKITVTTKTESESKYNWISINSEKFRNDVLLSQIEFPGDEISNPLNLFLKENFINERDSFLNAKLVGLLKKEFFNNFDKGTVIIIENIDDSVIALMSEFDETENEIKLEETAFYKSLAVLITPLKLNSTIQKQLLKEGIIDKIKKTNKGDKGFSIKFATNRIADVENETEPVWIPINPVSILEGFDYRVYGKVNTSGAVNGKISFNRLKDNNFVQKFTITPEEIFEKNIPLKTDVGEFIFDIRVYDRGESESLSKVQELIKAKDKTEVRNILNTLLGIRISKNGFGVKPYGEETKDWLGLGQLRVQDPGHNLSINQILGYLFFFSPENDNLKEKTNREGFYESQAFIQVRQITLSILKNIGDLRYNYRLRHNLGRTFKNKLIRPNIKKFLQTLDKTTDITSARTEAVKFMNDVTKTLDTLESSLSFSERLASLGSGVELVYHELAQPISQLNNTKSSLKLKEDKFVSEKIKELFLKDINFLGTAISVIKELRDSLKPAVGKSVKKEFYPHDTFLKVCKLFQSDLAKYNIGIKIDSELEKYEILDNEYPLWISFLNIINNAIYWLKYIDGQRNISILLEKKKIIISNNGPEIDENFIDLIFEYGVTSKKEKSATGLGLAFTRNILRINDWSITAENRKDGPAFIITKIKN